VKRGWGDGDGERDDERGFAGVVPMGMPGVEGPYIEEYDPMSNDEAPLAAPISPPKPEKFAESQEMPNPATEAVLKLMS
jgi:hypothetical protein